MRSVFILLLSTVLASCGTDKSTDMVFDPNSEGEQDANQSVEATFAFIQETIFDRSCATSGCHVTTYPNLSAGQSHAAIVNGASSAGPNQPLIKPGDPENSYLFLKITGASSILGNRMPLGRPALSDAYIAAVRTWIERGAPND